MSADLWALCQGDKAICKLETTAWRVVEAQHISATRKLVDSLEEQMILEELLDTKAKPPVPIEAEFNGLHYLLSTPFRYPPLQYGSRFGTRLQRSLWYGSLLLDSAFAEVAFYRLLFFKGTNAVLKGSQIQLTAYQAKIKTVLGIYLHQPLFSEYTAHISHKNDYQYSQALGTQLRAANIQAFTYYSARSEDAINIGVFTPKAFAQKSPLADSQQTWLCYSHPHQIEFTRSSLLKNPQHLVFTEDYFYDAGRFPFTNPGLIF